MTKPSRAISRCNSAETFGGSAEPSGVCSVARRSAAPRFRGGRPAQGWFEIANAQPGQRGLHSVHDARAFPDQAPALPVRPLGVLFGHRRDARHAAMTPFTTQPPQERPLQQLGVEPIGLGPSMFPRYGDTRGMDHMRLHPTRPQPARQPEAIAAGFEGQRNPRDLAAGLDRLGAPAMQQAKQPFCTRLQLLARLALNAGKHTGNQPTRLAHLDDGNHCAILVQGDEGPAQVVRLGHQGTPSVRCSDDGAISSPPAPYHLAGGGGGIRTLGPRMWVVRPRTLNSRTLRRERCLLHLARMALAGDTRFVVGPEKPKVRDNNLNILSITSQYEMNLKPLKRNCPITICRIARSPFGTAASETGIFPIGRVPISMLLTGGYGHGSFRFLSVVPFDDRFRSSDPPGRCGDPR